MKLIRRIIILIIAAALGTFVYYRLHALSNLVGGGEHSASSFSSSDNAIGNVGGIGPVGNGGGLIAKPQKPQRTPRRAPQRH